MKSKDPDKKFESKFRIVKVKDGRVDLSKFEIEIRNSKVVLKVIRDDNKSLIKRERSAYNGPEEAIFYECEQ